MLDFSTRSTLNLVHSATPFFLSWAASLPALRSSLPVRRPSWPPSSKLLSRHVKTCPMNLCVPSIVFGNFELRYYNSETTEGSSSSSQNREPGLLLRSLQCRRTKILHRLIRESRLGYPYPSTRGVGHCPYDSRGSEMTNGFPGVFAHMRAGLSLLFLGGGSTFSAVLYFPLCFCMGLGHAIEYSGPRTMSRLIIGTNRHEDQSQSDTRRAFC